MKYLLAPTSRRTETYGGVDLIKLNPVAEGYRPVRTEDPLIQEIDRCYLALQVCAERGLLSNEHIRGRVVDFGCGIGGSTWALSACGADVIGVDARVHLGTWRQQPSWMDSEALAAFEKLQKLKPQKFELKMVLNISGLFRMDVSTWCVRLCSVLIILTIHPLQDSF